MILAPGRMLVAKFRDHKCHRGDDGGAGAKRQTANEPAPRPAIFSLHGVWGTVGQSRLAK